jgi:hypothetical protein
MQTAEYCMILFRPGLCGHTWSVSSIRLAKGTNLIKVSAFDSAGNLGRKQIVVTRLPDTFPPVVLSTIPVSGANAVATNSSLSIRFNEVMEPATISSATILLKDSAGNPVSGSVSYGALVATFTPLTPLLGQANYTVRINESVKDTSGNAMAAPFSWGFKTAAAPDTTPPAVSVTSPADGTTCAPIEAREFIAKFSEPVWFQTPPYNTIRIEDNLGSQISGTVTPQWDGLAAYFYPDHLLAASTFYTGVVRAGLQDFAGNSSVQEHRWTFRTQVEGTGLWSSTSIRTPLGGEAVWTGTELILWGGPSANAGVRYDPSTDTWKSMSSIGAHPATSGYTLVWTGSKLIAWGGISPFEINSGAIYDPSTDSWKPMSLSGAPTPRWQHTAVWTGAEMIIWGGAGGETDGARYNPDTDSWAPVASPGALLLGRYGHTAVWDGVAMHIWGGNSTAVLANSGASYTPSTDSWTAIPNANAPSARRLHSAVWTGDEMIIWGGHDGLNPLGTGAGFSPSLNSWRSINVTCAPTARHLHKGVWTGREMIIWGGTSGTDLDIYKGSYYKVGGRYNPVTDTWQSTPILGVTEGRIFHSATWVGTELIVLGGIDVSRAALDRGLRYRPQQ